MITEERLQELTTYGREAMPYNAEMAELIRIYRERQARTILCSNNLTINKGSDGTWLFFKAPNGEQAGISVECWAAKNEFMGNVLRAWSDAL